MSPVIISCAGLGSRLGHNIPKGLVNVCGKTLIEYQLELLQDFDDIRIVVGYKADLVRRHVNALGYKVKFFMNEKYENTTNAYSYYIGSKDINGSFFTLDADLLIKKNDFNHFVVDSKEKGNFFCVTSAKSEDAILVEFKNNRVLSFTENTSASHEWCGLAYMANYKFHQAGEFYFGGYQKELPAFAKKIECYEIDTPQDLNLAIKNFHRLGYVRKKF